MTYPGTNTKHLDTGKIREKLQAYILIAPESKVKALFTLLGNEIEGNDLLAEDDLISLMEEDIVAWESGNQKSYKWDDVKKEGQELLKRFREE